MIIIYRRIKYRRENDIIQCSVIGMDKSNNSEADGNFDTAPYFNFNDGKVKFDTNRIDNPNDNCGSASGFVPKSHLINGKGCLTKTPFRLVRFGRTNPATKHTSNLVNHSFKSYILF